MDLDNFIIGKTKERRGESWEKSNSCFGLRQFHHQQNKKEQLVANIEVGGEERSGELGKTVQMLLAKKTAVNLPYKQIEQ
jgi:hypothetical protein